MNYNVYAYIIFLAVMVFIIGYVGRHFFINGKVFIRSIMNENRTLADHVNQLLLLAYYLFNIGYAFIKLRYWPKINNPELLVSSLAFNIGILIFILAVTHYFNMLAIYLFLKSKSISITNKSFQS